MRTSILSLGLLVAGTLAHPAANTDSLAACRRAPNCETYEDPRTNRTQMRFTPDKGPNSKWYHDHVRLKDKHHPMNKHSRKLMARDDETHSNVDRSLTTISFGTNNVVDAVNSMYDNCLQFNCDKDWELDTTVLNADGATASGATLAISASGEWDSSDPDNRANLIEALKAQASPSSSEDKAIVVDAYNSDDEYMTFYVGPQNIGINRYSGEGLHSFMNIGITLVTADDDLCDFVTGLLGDAIGAIDGIAGGFFGAFGDVLCTGLEASSQ